MWCVCGVFLAELIMSMLFCVVSVVYVCVCVTQHTHTHTRTHTHTHIPIHTARGFGAYGCGEEREIQGKGKTAGAVGRVQGQQETQRQRKLRCLVVGIAVALASVNTWWEVVCDYDIVAVCMGDSPPRLTIAILVSACASHSYLGPTSCTARHHTEKTFGTDRGLDRSACYTFGG